MGESGQSSNQTKRFRYIIYRLETAVNSAVLYTWKLLKEWILKILITHKKIILNKEGRRKLSEVIDMFIS